MVEFGFRWGREHISFTIPERNLLYHAQLGILDAAPDEKRELERALSSPIGLPGLRTMADRNSRVVVVVDDLTRATPQRRLLPVVLDHLNSVGVPDENIKVIIALGTHRPMDDREILERFGESVLARVPVVNHDFADPKKHVNLGRTRFGTPIEINREVYEADLRITLGMVCLHPLAGWGGGAKMIQPGTCSERTTESTHFIGGTYEAPLTLPGNPESPVRLEIEEVALRVGPLFTINSVVSHQGELIRCFAGHCVASHREATKLASLLFRPTVPQLADVVVCNAYPADRDFWQGFKPFYYSQFGVREGGTVILVIFAPEGLSGNAPSHVRTMRKWSTEPPDRILRALADGEIRDRVAGSVCVAHARLLRRVRVIGVSAGINAEDMLSIGFEPAASIDEALGKAMARHGRNAKLGVIPNGGETLVRVAEVGVGYQAAERASAG